MATEVYPMFPTGGATRPFNTYICATTTDRDAITGMREGETAYCADTDTYYGWDGSAWQTKAAL